MGKKCISNRMLIKGYTELSFIPSGSNTEFSKPVVHIKLDSNIMRLFPYINAIIEDAVYYENPRYIKFIFDGYIFHVTVLFGFLVTFDLLFEDEFS